jgi:hypothetical protein
MDQRVARGPDRCTLRFLLGELALRHARLGHASPAMRGEDRAFLAFETSAGAPVSMLANLLVHGEPPGMVDRLTLVGTRGTLVQDGDTLRCFGPEAAYAAGGRE